MYFERWKFQNTITCVFTGSYDVPRIYIFSIEVGFTQVDENFQQITFAFFYSLECAIWYSKANLVRKIHVRVAKGRKCLHEKKKKNLSINWQNIKLKGTNNADKWGTIRAKPLSSSKFNFSFDSKTFFVGENSQLSFWLSQAGLFLRFSSRLLKLISRLKSKKKPCETETRRALQWLL